MLLCTSGLTEKLGGFICEREPIFRGDQKERGTSKKQERAGVPQFTSRTHPKSPSDLPLSPNF